MLHRVSGLGVVLFLILHVIDTSWAVFYPALYERAIASYQSPLFTLGEFGLVACVVYHAFNGIRIAIMDYNPRWWKHQERAAFIVFGLTVLTLIPTFVVMFAHVVKHYSADHVFVMPLGEVLVEQLPFAIGMAVAAVAALLFSFMSGLLVGGGDKPASKPAQGSRFERFWWSYMRISGFLILPLVFGHLAMVHLIQGVFDLTTAGAPIVGTNFINEQGLAVEFVGSRWSFALAGVAIWKLYDIGLLALVTIHGFNGLRYVLTDYTMFSPLLRRASVYLCIIGAIVLLVLGAGALLGSINQASIDMAIESACELGRDLAVCE